MKHLKKRAAGFLLILALITGLCVNAGAVETTDLRRLTEESAAWMLAAVPVPQVGSIGGEWAVIGLARSGYAVPRDYWDRYMQQVEQTVKDCGGVLHARKYTEYSRLVLALTAIGADPTDVDGYDLLTPLGDYEKVIWQGVNGPIYALLALDSGGYDLPEVRERYVDDILSRQLPEGGWSLSKTSDPDLTGMALQALAKYRGNPQVDAAIEKAFLYLASCQDETGGFGTLESTAQVLVALCELGLGWEETLVKNQNTVLDGLLRFRNGDGSFLHEAHGSGSGQMASEQGLYALVAAVRFAEGQLSLYTMRSVGGAETVSLSPMCKLIRLGWRLCIKTMNAGGLL